MVTALEKSSFPTLKPKRIIEHATKRIKGEKEVNQNMTIEKKIVVGMSGGVDSSMSLVLLKKAGWDLVGVSLKLASWEDKRNCLSENVCCTSESLEIARDVCKKLKVPYHIYDVSGDFRKEVIGYFVKELRAKRTPNPCMMCNRRLKFKKLFEWADQHGIRYVATGHYAKTVRNPKTSKYELRRPRDSKKDQTYGLSFLPREWLSRIRFPLADLTKEEVYKYAQGNGFKIFLKRKESQDLCFASRKAMPLMIEEKLGKKQGNIIDSEGRVLGKHNGLHFFTIGQKKGLKLPGRYFVKGFDVKKNIIIVTQDRSEICAREVLLYPFNLLVPLLTKSIMVKAKTRYRQRLSDATFYPAVNGRLKVVFSKPQEAITPGQFCVFYKGKTCLGGGMIREIR